MKKEDFAPFLKRLKELIQEEKLLLISADGEAQYIAEFDNSKGRSAIKILLRVLSDEARERLRPLEKSVSDLLQVKF